MKVFKNLNEVKLDKRTIVTIGTFDGVHMGHQKVISKILNTAKNENLESIIVTFAQHPRNVLNNNDDVAILNTTSEKLDLLQKLGVQNVLLLDFNDELANLTGEEFVEKVLINKLKIQKIIIGYDHRFGKNRASDIHDLINFGKKFHFDVEQISAEEINEITISSTKIRNAILSGNITEANTFLGYTYFINASVEKGKQLGRTIQFPTANLKVNSVQKLIPQNGVYLVKGFWDDQSCFGMMNIGNRPTVNGQNTTIEVHFLNFDQDIYDKEIRIEFFEKIRNEQKFNSIEDLKIQLEQDKLTALQFFNLD